MAREKTSLPSHKPWWKGAGDKITFLLIIAAAVFVSPGQNIYLTLGQTRSPIVRQLPFPLPRPAPYPINHTGIYPADEITATAVAVADVDSAVFLFKRNAQLPLAPASTTKIMTALVALDAYKLDDVLTVKTVMNTGQVMGLVAGERMTVENLLYGALVQSGNDAAYALAENYPAGMTNFIEAMNQKAKQYHLSRTVYANPVGYDDLSQKMTAEDLSLLARVALANKIIAKMVAIPQITVSDVTHTYFHPLKNVNELLGKIPGVGGIKTGWTEEAGENLVTLVERNNRKLILVVLQSRNRFEDTTKLIDWVFANYRWEDLTPM